MRVLVVEDDERKRTQLNSFVAEEIPNATIEVAKSLQSGLRSVRQSAPDLILLDMTLPSYDASPEESGGQIHPLGGREFLAQMDRFDIRTPVVVVTQFETFGKGRDAMTIHDLDETLKKRYSRIYCGIVSYNAAVQGWKPELKASIERALREGAGAQ
jgi:CheY-like chemotaxis protein